MIAAAEYVENILIIVHLLVVSVHEAIRNCTQFCKKIEDQKCVDNITELWRILAWLRLVEQGRASGPCPTKFYWSDLSNGLTDGLTDGLRCLKKRASLTELATLSRILHFHFIRADDGVQQLLESLDTKGTGLEIRVPNTMPRCSTGCGDCERGCSGCASKNLMVKMKCLRKAAGEFSEVLNWCAYDFANLSEDDSDLVRAQDEGGVNLSRKHKISEDGDNGGKCKMLRVR